MKGLRDGWLVYGATLGCVLCGGQLGFDVNGEGSFEGVREVGAAEGFDVGMAVGIAEVDGNFVGVEVVEGEMEGINVGLELAFAFSHSCTQNSFTKLSKPNPCGGCAFGQPSRHVQPQTGGPNFSKIPEQW